MKFGGACFSLLQTNIFPYYERHCCCSSLCDWATQPKSSCQWSSTHCIIYTDPPGNFFFKNTRCSHPLLPSVFVLLEIYKWYCNGIEKGFYAAVAAHFGFSFWPTIWRIDVFAMTRPSHSNSSTQVTDWLSPPKITVLISTPTGECITLFLLEILFWDFSYLELSHLWYCIYRSPSGTDLCSHLPLLYRFLLLNGLLHIFYWSLLHE